MQTVRRVGRVGLALLMTTLGMSGRALAQVDFSGAWKPLLYEDVAHRADDTFVVPGVPGTGGPRIGDYTGLSINDAARLKADSWNPALNTAHEHQTVVQPAGYWLWGPGAMQISTVTDDAGRLVALKIFRAGIAASVTRTIWMDGRPDLPDYAAHTWQGFSRGRWDGDMLT